ncbi:oxidoreductase, partial [Thioclava sp. BHET1]
MTARLFEPLKIGGLTLENRIIVAPMCQYSAQDGNATDWHIMHFGQMTQSGAGLFVLEATAVSPEARITNWDLGLYSEENEAALARALEAAALHGDVPMAVQLAHAGRKASCARPWHGGGQIAAQDPAGWQTVSASALPFDPANPAPTALDAEGLRKVREDFVAAALRARRLGLRGIELHMAHGYLLHQFLSPLSNQREDA